MTIFLESHTLKKKERWNVDMGHGSSHREQAQQNSNTTRRRQSAVGGGFHGMIKLLVFLTVAALVGLQFGALNTITQKKSALAQREKEIAEREATAVIRNKNREASIRAREKALLVREQILFRNRGEIVNSTLRNGIPQTDGQSFLDDDHGTETTDTTTHSIVTNSTEQDTTITGRVDNHRIETNDSNTSSSGTEPLDSIVTIMASSNEQEISRQNRLDDMQLTSHGDNKNAEANDSSTSSTTTTNTKSSVDSGTNSGATEITNSTTPSIVTISASSNEQEISRQKRLDDMQIGDDNSAKTKTIIPPNSTAPTTNDYSFTNSTAGKSTNTTSETTDQTRLDDMQSTSDGDDNSAKITTNSGTTSDANNSIVTAPSTVTPNNTDTITVTNSESIINGITINTSTTNSSMISTNTRTINTISTTESTTNINTTTTTTTNDTSSNATTSTIIWDEETAWNNMAPIKRSQIESYRNQTALIVNIHPTHHAGTAFCKTIGRNGINGLVTPEFACMGDKKSVVPVEPTWCDPTKDPICATWPEMRLGKVPWSEEETGPFIDAIRPFFHMVSWEFSKPRPGEDQRFLDNPNWEHPNLVSAIITRHPLSRMLATDSKTHRRFPGYTMGNLNHSQWWDYSVYDNNPNTDNFFLRIMATSRRLKFNKKQRNLRNHIDEGINRTTEELLELFPSRINQTHFERTKNLLDRFTFVLDIACLEEGMDAVAQMLRLDPLPDPRTNSEQQQQQQQQQPPRQEIQQRRLTKKVLTKQEKKKRKKERMDAIKKLPPKEKIKFDDVYEYLVAKNHWDIALYEYSKTISIVRCNA